MNKGKIESSPNGLESNIKLIIRIGDENMAGLHSLNKGKREERAIYSLLQPIVDEVYKGANIEPPLLQRNLMQSRLGGYDIVGLDWLALEVKHQENLQVKQWWAQAKRQASGDQEAILIYRKNRMARRVVMYGYLPAGSKRVRAPVDISVDSFLVYFKIRLLHEIGHI